MIQQIAYFFNTLRINFCLRFKLLLSINLGDDFMLDKISLILVIVGALNWGSIGLFQFDLVAWIGGGQGALVSRIIYTLVALAGVWCISMLFRDREELEVGTVDTVE